jgi:surface polysaccharide O-acyltransferase-like enzyme
LEERFTDSYLSKKIKVSSFVSIVMVVFLHAYNLEERYLQPFTRIHEGKSFLTFFQYFISNGVTRIAVPLFFTISGYLFFFNFTPGFRGVMCKYKSRFKTVLIPYVIWSILAIIFIYITQNITFTSNMFWVKPIRYFNLQDFLKVFLKEPVGYHLWFLKDLIVYVLFSPVIYLLASKLSYWSLIPFALRWISDPGKLRMSPEGMFFFLIGSIIAIKKHKLNRSHAKFAVNFLLVGWMTVLSIKTYLAYDGSPALIYLHKLSILLGLVAFWFAYDVYIGEPKDSSWIFKLTPYTFFIYGFHTPLIVILTEIFIRLLGRDTASLFIIYAVASLITIILAVSVGWFLLTFTAPLYGLLTGNRIGNVAIKSEAEGNTTTA